MRRNNHQFENRSEKAESIPVVERICQWRTLFMGIIYLLSATVLTGPPMETLAELQHGNLFSAQSLTHALQRSSQTDGSPAFLQATDHGPHTHSTDHDCPSPHSHTDCNCLCCPGHIMAMSATAFSNFGQTIPDFEVAPAFHDTLQLPSGVRADIFRPPQPGVPATN